MKSFFNTVVMLFMLPFIILGYLSCFVISPFMTGFMLAENKLKEMTEYETTKTNK